MSRTSPNTSGGCPENHVGIGVRTS
jgi:hypothetical protein